MTLLSRLLVTFALGLIATGATLGFLPAGERGCGAAFTSGDPYTETCAEPRAQRRASAVTLIGLGLTLAIGAAVVVDSSRG